MVKFELYRRIKFTSRIFFTLSLLIFHYGISQKLVEFESHLLQRVAHNEFELGSWRAGLKGTVLLATEAAKPNSRRGIPLAEISELALTPQLFQTLIERSTGFIITVPSDIIKFLENKYNQTSTDFTQEEFILDALKKIKEFEQHLLQRKFNLALYFTWQTPQLEKMFETLKYSNKLFSSRVSVATKFTEPKAIEIIRGFNFAGWAPSRPTTYSPSEPETTIAIVAHYDAFSIVPGLSFDMTGISSGLLAFINLIHLLGPFINQHNPPNFRVEFIMLSGSTYNFIGAQQWLSQSDRLLLDSIDFALCLEDLGKPELNLHLSKPIKNKTAQKFIAALEKSASTYESNLNVIIDRINPKESNKWSHEPFNKQSVTAATLTHLKESKADSFQSSIFDNKLSNIQEINLRKQIKLIAEAFGHFMFDFEDYNIQLFEEIGDSYKFFESWNAGLSRSPRFFRTMKKEDPFFIEIENLYSSFLTSFERTNFTLTEATDYFEDTPVNLVLRKTKNPLFDAFHLFFNLIYLAFIYLIVSKGKGFYILKSWILGPKSNKSE